MEFFKVNLLVEIGICGRRLDCYGHFWPKLPTIMGTDQNYRKFQMTVAVVKKLLRLMDMIIGNINDTLIKNQIKILHAFSSLNALMKTSFWKVDSLSFQWPLVWPSGTSSSGLGAAGRGPYLSHSAGLAFTVRSPSDTKNIHEVDRFSEDLDLSSVKTKITISKNSKKHQVGFTRRVKMGQKYCLNMFICCQ